jgi:hemolysin III
MLAIPALFEKLGWGSVALLIAATLTYTGGAVCFARKSPDPMPTVFGYHEVWHVFTLLAGGLQLLLTIRLVAA